MLEWNAETHMYEGITSDGKYLVQVPKEVVDADREDSSDPSDWATADDWAADFNDRDEAVVTPITK